MKKKEYKYNYEIIKTKKIVTYCDKDVYPEYLLGDTLSEAETIFKKFSVYINRLARFYSIISKIDRAEFFGEAVIALGKAKNDYNKKMGKFEPFAKYIITDSMNEVVRKNRTIIKIPSYIYKTNKIINRVKKIVNGYVTDDEFDYMLYTDTIHIELPDNVINKINKNKLLIENIAKRASTTYDELLNRAYQLPLVVKFEVEKLDNINCDNTYTSLPIKLFVKEIMVLLSNDEQIVAKLIMEDKDKSEISRITSKSNYWVNQRIKSIKNTFLGIKG